MHLALIIFRVQEGFDFSEFFTSVPIDLESKEPEPSEKTRFDFNFLPKMAKMMSEEQQQRKEIEVPPQVMASVNRFQHKQTKGTIDIWWLYDTGGITMLLAWILRNTRNSLWYGCKLRVFSVTRSDIQTAKSK